MTKKDDFLKEMRKSARGASFASPPTEPLKFVPYEKLQDLKSPASWDVLAELYGVGHRRSAWSTTEMDYARIERRIMERFFNEMDYDPETARRFAQKLGIEMKPYVVFDELADWERPLRNCRPGIIPDRGLKYQPRPQRYPWDPDLPKDYQFVVMYGHPKSGMTLTGRVPSSPAWYSFGPDGPIRHESRPPSSYYNCWPVEDWARSTRYELMKIGRMNSRSPNYSSVTSALMHGHRRFSITVGKLMEPFIQKPPTPSMTGAFDLIYGKKKGK